MILEIFIFVLIGLWCYTCLALWPYWCQCLTTFSCLENLTCESLPVFLCLCWEMLPKLKYCVRQEEWKYYKFALYCSQKQNHIFQISLCERRAIFSVADGEEWFIIINIYTHTLMHSLNANRHMPLSQRVKWQASGQTKIIFTVTVMLQHLSPSLWHTVCNYKD